MRIILSVDGSYVVSVTGLGESSHTEQFGAGALPRTVRTEACEVGRGAAHGPVLGEGHGDARARRQTQQPRSSQKGGPARRAPGDGPAPE